MRNATNMIANDFNNTTAKIYDCISDTIGNTPLVRLLRISETELFGNLLAKVECFNPMSSIKDRPAKAMIDALVSSKHFTSDTHIIEPTSGNNGVSCAWLCAIYQIPLTIVIPEHMSIERQKMIKHFGANVVTTPKALGTKGSIDHAKKLVESMPNAVMLNQFANEENPRCHAYTTAQELIRDTQGNIDVLVAGVGTGGTITGIGSVLKAEVPNVEIVAVEPEGCPVLSKGFSGVHKIQGLSSGHVPDVLNQKVIDQIVTVKDETALEYGRLLARKEGIAVGISSGATVYVGCQLAKQPKYHNKNIVVILADTAERYYSTELFE